MAEKHVNAVKKPDAKRERQVLAVLEAIHDKTGQDIFVATFSAAQKDGSPECLSFATWSEGVDTLLPHASEIALMRRKGSGFDTAVRVPWEHVQTVAGDLMEPQDMYPERYRVQRFPTPDQIAQMKALQGNAA